MATTEKPQENGAETGGAETGDTLNRREALKLIAAASGALALASIPAEWTKPELRFGVLPAYAQTSGLLTIASCSATPGTFLESGSETFTAQISAAVAGVSILLEFFFNGLPSAPFTLTTDSSGLATDGPRFLAGLAGVTIEARFSFVDSTVGTGSCSVFGTIV